MPEAIQIPEELSRLDRDASLLMEFFKLTYSELDSMKMSLDDDPVSKGLINLQKKIADIRALQNRSYAIVQKAIKIRTIIQKGNRICKTYFRLKFNQAFTNSPATTTRISKEEKESVAEISIQDYKDYMDKWDYYMDEARSFYDIARLTHDNLIATKDDILSQTTVIRAQIMIGEIPSKVGSLEKAPSSLQEVSI